MRSAIAATAAVLVAAGAQPSWEQKKFVCGRPTTCADADCCTLSLTLLTRDQPDTSIREVRAVGEIDATPARVYAVLTDYAHYVEFMPYTVGSEVLMEDGSDVVVWGMIDPPVIAKRDWVTRSRNEADLPGGIYRTTWHVEPDLGPPPARGVVRMTVNNGSWTLVPIDSGKRTRATFEQASDPGGMLPGFIVRAASTDGLMDLFAAIRSRAVPIQ